MTEKYNDDNPRFRDEFGCVNDLLTGESYICGNSAMIGERDALDTAIALCELLNNFYNENQQLKETIRKMIVDEFTITKEDLNKEENTRITGLTNQILIEFCKSKGHTLEEITEFVEGLPNE